MTVYRLEERDDLPGEPGRYAIAELLLPPGPHTVSAWIQCRDHPGPPAIVADWIGGLTAAGDFWQVGILQEATGPGTTTPRQLLAWVTQSRDDADRPGDRLPKAWIPLETPYPGGVMVAYDRGVFRAGSRILAELRPAPELATFQVAHETRSGGPPTGWLGVFRGIRVDGRIPRLRARSQLPAGAIWSSSPGALVLADVAPSSSPAPALTWP